MCSAVTFAFFVLAWKTAHLIFQTKRNERERKKYKIGGGGDNGLLADDREMVKAEEKKKKEIHPTLAVIVRRKSQ